LDRIRQRTALTGGRPSPHDVNRGPGSFRFWLSRADVLLLVPIFWLIWSIGGALAAPGADTTGTRLTNWGRSHGLAWVLSDPQPHASSAKAGARTSGRIQGISPSRPGSGRPTAVPTPAGYLAPPWPIPPQSHPALPGEGFWQTLVSLHGLAAIQAAFLRPDSQFTNTRVAVAWLNQKLVKMVLHPGFTAPGGSGWSQPPDVPSSERDALMATFNSGFLMPAAQGGYWQDNHTAVPLRRGAASMVLYKDGHLDVVNWQAATPGPDIAAVRQNLTLLVDNSAITAAVNSASWGATLGGLTYVWRSAVGIRGDGALVFVVGPSLSARTLANIVLDAGAVRAMELDINPEWTNFITYAHLRPGVAVPQMLTKDEQPNPFRYLQPSSRDFVAVLAR
jgi:hypothetical protein